MKQMMRTISGALFRGVLLLAGLVFLVSLLAVSLLVLAAWLGHALWARLTGRPVRPWTFQVNRQAFWRRFNRAPQGDSSNVVDVESREVKAPER